MPDVPEAPSVTLRLYFPSFSHGLGWFDFSACFSILQLLLFIVLHTWLFLYSLVFYLPLSLYCFTLGDYVLRYGLCAF